MRICWIIITLSSLLFMFFSSIRPGGGGGGGGTPERKCDASLKIKINCLKGTSLDMAQALFDPFYGDLTATRISLSGRS